MAAAAARCHHTGLAALVASAKGWGPGAAHEAGVPGVDRPEESHRQPSCGGEPELHGLHCVSEGVVGRGR